MVPGAALGYALIGSETKHAVGFGAAVCREACGARF